MLKKSFRRGARKEAPDQPAASPDTPTPDQSAQIPDQPAQIPDQPAQTPDQPAASRQTPASEYAALGPDAPIAWPSGARRVPVTGKLPPHAVAALERMGITKTSE